MKRKEIKWRREGRGTMAGRQDGIIFRIFHPWDAPERGHTVSCYDTRGTGRDQHGGIPEIDLEEERPGVYLEGEVIEEIRNRVEKMIVQEAEAIKSVWQELYGNICAASGVFAKWITAVAAQIEEKHELETALRWASCYYRPAFNRYRHTKKKRTRKKYEKKILAWYREEVL